MFRARALVVIAGLVAATLVPAAPAAGSVVEVTGVTPSKVNVSDGVTTLHISGTGLDGGVVSIPGVPADRFGWIVAGEPGGLDVEVNFRGLPYGTYDVTVTDPGDGTAATCAGCLQLGERPGGAYLTQVTPGDGTLTLDWFESPHGSAPVDHYRVSWADATGPVGEVQVTEPPITLTGLTNGVDYTIRIVTSSSWGDSGAVVWPERVGTPPDRPTITGYHSAVLAAGLYVHVDEYWTLRQQLTWDIRWTAPDGTTGTQTDSVPVLSARQRGTYVVQVRARNGAGASPWSAPADVKVIAAPSPPRHLRASALGSPVRLTWDPPAATGGSPVTGYVVQVYASSGPTRTFSTTSRSLVLRNLAPGRTWGWSVYAVNKATEFEPGWEESADGPYFDTGTVAAVATTASGTARWLGPDATTWQGLGTRVFASPPTPMRARGRTYFVGSTPGGAVLMRTLAGAWHRVPSVPCFDAAAQVGSGNRLWVACRDGSGRLVQLHAYLPADGLPTRLVAQSYVDRPKIVGGPTIGTDVYGTVIAYRSPVVDRYGSNVRVVEAGGDHPRHVALNCPARPMIATTRNHDDDAVHHYAVACRLDQRHVAWAWVGFPDGAHAKGVATLPFAIAPGIAAGYPAARLQLYVRASDGVRRYDVATRTWRALSGSSARSLVAVTWTL